MMEPKKTWHQKHKEGMNFSAKLADALASKMGSWGFIIFQSAVVVLWISLNIIGYVAHWDPYPFILLNLVLGTQSAYAAPIIMMAQNRQEDRDRMHAEEDYETNRIAKGEIEALQVQLNKIDQEKLDRIISLLEKK